MLTNDAAQPVRDPQPESSIDAALGDAFTSQGRSNTIRFLGEFESVFASYLARRGLVTIGDFEEAEARAYIRWADSSPARQNWRRATGYKGWNPMLADETRFTKGG